jgi:hypothetical protein
MSHENGVSGFKFQFVSLAKNTSSLNLVGVFPAKLNKDFIQKSLHINQEVENINIL